MTSPFGSSWPVAPTPTRGSVPLMNLGGVDAVQQQNSLLALRMKAWESKAKMAEDQLRDVQSKAPSRSEVDELREQTQRLQAEAARLQTQLRERSNENTRLQKENMALKEFKTDAERRFKEHEQRSASLQKEIDELKAATVSHGNQTAELSAGLHDATRKLGIADSENAELRATVQQLRKQLDSASNSAMVSSQSSALPSAKPAAAKPAVVSPKVGEWVEVYFPENKEWQIGQVTAFDTATARHTVRYENGGKTMKQPLGSGAWQCRVIAAPKKPEVALVPAAETYVNPFQDLQNDEDDEDDDGDEDDEDNDGDDDDDEEEEVEEEEGEEREEGEDAAETDEEEADDDDDDASDVDMSASPTTAPAIAPSTPAKRAVPSVDSDLNAMWSSPLGAGRATTHPLFEGDGASKPDVSSAKASTKAAVSASPAKPTAKRAPKSSARPSPPTPGTEAGEADLDAIWSSPLGAGRATNHPCWAAAGAASDHDDAEMSDDDSKMDDDSKIDNDQRTTPHAAANSRVTKPRAGDASEGGSSRKGGRSRQQPRAKPAATPSPPRKRVSTASPSPPRLSRQSTLAAALKTKGEGPSGLRPYHRTEQPATPYRKPAGGRAARTKAADESGPAKPSRKRAEPTDLPPATERSQRRRVEHPSPDAAARSATPARNRHGKPAEPKPTEAEPTAASRRRGAKPAEAESPPPKGLKRGAKPAEAESPPPKGLKRGAKAGGGESLQEALVSILAQRPSFDVLMKRVAELGQSVAIAEADVQALGRIQHWRERQIADKAAGRRWWKIEQRMAYWDNDKLMRENVAALLEGIDEEEGMPVDHHHGPKSRTVKRSDSISYKETVAPKRTRKRRTSVHSRTQEADVEAESEASSREMCCIC